MGSYIYFFPLVIGFVLMNIVPAAGAFYLARRLNRGGWPELLSLAFLLFFFEVILVFGVLGAIGQLQALTCCLGGILAGGILCFLGRKDGGKIPEFASLGLPGRVLGALTAGILLLWFYWASGMHSGTDTFLYHFYYPAMWLSEGRIHAVSLAGLPHEYFPVYGELLFGWFMLPFEDASFAIFVQLFSIIMAAAAVMAMARVFGFSGLAGLAAVCLMFFTSIIAEVSILGYSDVLNGSFLLTGISLALIGALRNDRKLAVIAGCALGCSAAIKYTGLMLTPLFVAGLLGVFAFRRRKLWKYSLFLAGAACIAASPCYLNNWIKTGNPFYPVKVVFANIPLFANGIDFERAAGGLKLDTWHMFVNPNIWDMNRTSGIFYLALPVLVIVLFIFRRPVLKKQYVFPVLAGIILILGGIQLCFYPAMAQARQIIPLLMCSSLLILPVAGRLMDTRSGLMRFGGIAGILFLCFFLSKTTYFPKMIFQWSFLSIFTLLLCFLPDRIFRYAILLAWGVFIVSLPFNFEKRFLMKTRMNYIFSSKAGGEITEIVWNHYKETNKNINIASVCSWYNYMFLADMAGNRVWYIPINEKNSTHPHDFQRYQEIRDNPVPYSVWLARLREKDIDYLVADYSGHADFMTNREQEVRWAEEHPETFEKLVDNGKIFFFRLKK